MQTKRRENLSPEIVRLERAEALEKIIGCNHYGFYEVGQALDEIKTEKLHHELGFKTFDIYYRRRWDFTKHYVNLQINLFRIAVNLLNNCYGKQKQFIADFQSSPINERNLHPLISLHPKQQKKVWEKLLKSGKPITEKLVRQAVTEYQTKNGLEKVNPRTGKPPKFSPLVKPSDNWNFNSVYYERITDETESQESWGYIPGELYLNCLWYYTFPGDVVVAPMAGSGQIKRVYNDRHRWMGENQWDLTLIMLDLNPQGQYKNEIIQNDLTKNLPVEKANYIVMDIPYFNMAKGQYSNQSDDIANMNFEQWQSAIIAIAGNCSKVQKARELCTIITPNYRDIPNHKILMLTYTLISIWETYGYQLHDKAYSSRRIQQAQNPKMAMMNNLAKKTKLC